MKSKCDLDLVQEFVRLHKQRDYHRKKYDTVQPGIDRTIERMAEDFNSRQIDMILKIWRKKSK